MAKKLPRGYRVENEPCGGGEIRRTFDREGKLSSAELWRGKRRHGWRLVVDPYDRESMRYTTLDGLGAYIHSRGRVGYYMAWGDGEELSHEAIDRDAWLARCFEDMRERARQLGARDTTMSKDEMLAWYNRLQGALESAWREGRYAEHREDAARAYVLENAILRATSTWDFSDPLGPRIANETYAFSYGLWALIAFQTRTQHFAEAESLLTGELADTTRMRIRLGAHPEQAERALAAGISVYTEQRNARAKRRGRDVLRTIRALVPSPHTRALAETLDRAFTASAR